MVTIAPMAENRMMDGIGIVETCKRAAVAAPTSSA